MRKQPLFAMSAFVIAMTAAVTLGASNSAGASTDSFHAVPASARTKIAAVRTAPRTTKGRRSHTARVRKSHRVPLYDRSLVVVHDLARPPHLKLSPVTGLPFVHKAKPKRKRPVVQAPPPPTTVPPTTVPPTTVPPTTTPPTPVTSSWWRRRRLVRAQDVRVGGGLLHQHR